MRKSDNEHWKRLEQVIKATNHSANSFAKHIGLMRGENLYQIKRGNNRISLDVARKIHRLYPEYSITWLLCGEEDPAVLTTKDAPVIRIPVCRNVWALNTRQTVDEGDRLIVSASVADRAQLAVPYTDDILDPNLRNSILLLRECRVDEIVYGNIYLVTTDHIRVFRIIQYNSADPDGLLLTTANPERFNDMVIRRNEIVAVWTVCGAICRMER